MPTLQVACPQCAALYSVPPEKIGPKGRKLKCAQCGHLWVVERPTAAAPVPAATPAAPTSEPAAPAPVPAAPEAAPAPAAATPEAVVEAPPPIPEEAIEITPPTVRLDDLTQPAWRVYLLGEMKWFTLALALVGLGLVGAGVALWQRLQPPAAPEAFDIYQPTAMQTARVVNAPAGVALVDVQASTLTSDSTVILTLQGAVMNPTSDTQVLPQLRAELVDETGTMLDMQPVALVTTTLPPVSEFAFAVSFTNPIGTGWRLNWVNR